MKSFLYNTITVSGFIVMLLLAVVFFTNLNNKTVYAQSDAEAVFLSNTPRYPEPYEQVKVSVTSRLASVEGRQTTWRRDGEIIAQGVGITEVTIKMGEAGETTRINFRGRVGEGIADIRIDITPVVVDLIWEAIDSYTPPFYKGKALHTGWGDVRVTTIPYIYNENGERFSKDELVYRWEFNGLRYGGDSGRGKNSFVTGTDPRPGNRVSVRIATPNGDVVANESISIPISQPEVHMYNFSQLFGPQFNTVTGNKVTMESGEDEIAVTGYPYYYLTGSSLAGNMQYNWQLNTTAVSTPDQKNIVRLRRPDDSSGQTRLELEIDDTNRIFPNRRSSTLIEF
jgi:hypothetical protein